MIDRVESMFRKHASGYMRRPCKVYGESCLLQIQNKRDGRHLLSNRLVCFIDLLRQRSNEGGHWWKFIPIRFLA